MCYIYQMKPNRDQCTLHVCESYISTNNDFPYKAKQIILYLNVEMDI